MPQHMIQHPNKILPGVYLGGFSSAQDLDTLKNKLKITHVLNCAKELACYHPKHFKYLRMEWTDKAKQEILPDFEKCFKFMDSCLLCKPPGRIFVHCQEGKSRSVSVLVGYFMSRKNFSMGNALATIASRRRIAQPNKGFMQQLKEFERTLAAEK